jgi:hypothetical protein
MEMLKKLLNEPGTFSSLNDNAEVVGLKLQTETVKFDNYEMAGLKP